VIPIAAACPVITITPPTAPDGTIGVVYTQTLTATGGTGTPTFSVASGVLPAGLTLTPGGVLSGTPTTAGSSTVVIQATDGGGCPGFVTYTIGIANAVPTLSQWAMIALTLLLALAGFTSMRRRNG
jgi:Putative Ig domain/IPTL-CTERM motif